MYLVAFSDQSPYALELVHQGGHDEYGNLTRFISNNANKSGIAISVAAGNEVTP